MKSRLITAADFRKALAESEVDSTTHFLVEENALGPAIDIGVVAKSKLPQAACALVQSQHLVEIVLSLPSGCLHYHPVLETQTHILNRTAPVGRGVAVANDTVDGGFDRTGEKFTSWDILGSMIVEKAATLNRERQIRIWGVYVDGVFAR